ncbi:hypothetical protein L1987_15368 [Smallanthus sonchifolius]|uniref:Uncharacterized protein n=1 Tax=Smallanthus sonchifolius TaxID=185202 RepID=A0ACB9J667_9ASTR|nr:hypothetical protein L1987_15368 [Smallanthus sonchifolius]
MALLASTGLDESDHVWHQDRQFIESISIASHIIPDHHGFQLLLSSLNRLDSTSRSQSSVVHFEDSTPRSSWLSAPPKLAGSILHHAVGRAFADI